MIEKIKYGLAKFFASKPMRVGCIAAIAVVTAAVVTLLNYSIYTVNISDGENTYTVHTLKSDVTNALSGANLKSQNYVVKETSTNGKITTVNIAYTYPVYITCGGATKEVTFSGGTVADALTLAGYSIDEFDFVEPAVDTLISKTAYIDYTNIDYVSGSYTESIPFATETVYSADTAKGVVKTVQSGSNGTKQVDYTEKLVNGVSVEKNITNTSILSTAVNAKQVVGTKIVAAAVKTSADVKSISVLAPASPIELDANGNPVNYKSKMTVRATAYTYTGNNCSTGVAPTPGYIAVNPKVIPYGTKMYIKSPDGSIIYGYAVAADTGGFIKKHPTGVDLFMASRSACISFGVKNMEIYILE